MAIYHLGAQIIGRAHGHSAVSAAAYRAGVRLTDARTGKTHDYTRKRGCNGAVIVAPEGSPRWALDRAELWNQAEAAERRRDAQVAREINLALPRELDPEAARALALRFAAEQFASRGMVADVACHHLGGSNPHAHLLLTTRALGTHAAGFGRKVREWNEHAMLLAWRESWADMTNAALRTHGERARIDHRSLAEQQAAALAAKNLPAAARLDREPTRHAGNTHAPAYRRRATLNARIATRNAARARVWARLLDAPAPSPAVRRDALPSSLVAILRASLPARQDRAMAGVLGLLAKAAPQRGAGGHRVAEDTTQEAHAEPDALTASAGLSRARLGAQALREQLAAALAEARQTRPARRPRGPRF